MPHQRWRVQALAAASMLLLRTIDAGYNLDLESRDSIKLTARTLSDDMMAFYTGDKPGGTPGLLPPPYYWWEAGAMFGALIDYWYFTGDSTFNQVTTDGMLFQVGPVRDYMPPNQTLTEGNDDQGFWGLAAMTAAEYNFPNPPKDQPQWLALAQAVFNTQAPRWDMDHCNGGLRWQIFDWNKGFNYKNSISMACFFALGARLALYTGNSSYANWADITWDWMIGTGFMNPQSYYIYDGAHVEMNCTDIVPYQWSYNAGGFLHGAAAMYNFTGSDVWRDRVDKLLAATGVFFRGPHRDIMTEVACEPVNLCNTDQQSFKAYLSRWLAVTTKWAPWTYKTIKPWLESSAKAAISKCVGGANGRMCGLKWAYEPEGWDPADLEGIGQQMSVMEVVIANLIHEVKPPMSADTGGTSEGDPGAGTDDIRIAAGLEGWEWEPIEDSDRAKAWAVTSFVIVFMLAVIAIMLIDDWSCTAWKRRMDDIKDGFNGALGFLRLRRNQTGQSSLPVAEAFVSAQTAANSRRPNRPRSQPATNKHTSSHRHRRATDATELTRRKKKRKTSRHARVRRSDMEHPASAQAITAPVLRLGTTQRGRLQGPSLQAPDVPGSSDPPARPRPSGGSAPPGTGTSVDTFTLATSGEDILDDMGPEAIGLAKSTPPSRTNSPVPDADTQPTNPYSGGPSDLSRETFTSSSDRTLMSYLPMLELASSGEGSSSQTIERPPLPSQAGSSTTNFAAPGSHRRSRSNSTVPLAAPSDPMVAPGSSRRSPSNSTGGNLDRDESLPKDPTEESDWPPVPDPDVIGLASSGLPGSYP